MDMHYVRAGAAATTGPSSSASACTTCGYRRRERARAYTTCRGRTTGEGRRGSKEGNVQLAPGPCKQAASGGGRDRVVRGETGRREGGCTCALRA
ncbi:hypothetical protein OH77DRAFT_830014 [Trametes cingulata]|nr:hypothetical protein OH77DRAFT_830014 [Trametes cingulata]